MVHGSSTSEATKSMTRLMMNDYESRDSLAYASQESRIYGIKD